MICAWLNGPAPMGWDPRIATARIFPAEAAAVALALGRATEAARLVVGAYAVGARQAVAGGVPVPLKYRERPRVQNAPGQRESIDKARITILMRDLGDDFRVMADAALAAWVRSATHPHRMPGHVSAFVSLKPIGGMPGDASADQMEAVEALAERISIGELSVSHVQDLALV